MVKAASLSPCHLPRYLTVDQALADFMDVLSHIRQTWPETKNSKVVTFGGSYGGMLAAWMRIRYPHLVDA